MAVPTLDANALRILEARYLRRDEAGTLVETPDALFDRVATAVAAAEERFDPAGRERWREAFLQTLSALEFLPNSPTLMNAGTGRGQLSACFVLPVADSLDKIFDALKQMVMIQQSGGGTGFSFSRLRPRGDPLRHTGGRSSGPVSFLRSSTPPPSTCARGKATRRQPGRAPGRPPGRARIRAREAAGRGALELQPLGRRARRLPRRGGRGPALGSPPPADRPRGPPPRGTRGDGRDRRLGLAGRRPRPPLPRRDRPGEPDAGPRPNRDHEPLRRGPAPLLRVVQPRLGEPGADGGGPRRAPGDGLGALREDRPPRRAVPGRRDRGEPPSPPPPAAGGARHPEDRAGRDGARGGARPAGSSLRVRGGGPVRRGGRARPRPRGPRGIRGSRPGAGPRSRRSRAASPPRAGPPSGTPPRRRSRPPGRSA